MEDRRISCSVCAWRSTCKKRFSQGDSFALHCPDFTFDLALKKEKKRDGTNDNSSSEQNDTI